MSLKSINPATGEVLETFPTATAAELDRILDEAVRAQASWRERPFADRARCLKRAAEILKGSKARFARTMALEMGKPLSQGEAEIEKCAWACAFYAGEAEGFLAPRLRPTDASKSYIRFDPIGTVLAIMPWNYPFWQVFRFAAPALMAGNAALLKHAPNVPRCALEIEETFRQAGFPEGLFRTLLVQTDPVPGLIADARIRAVTLTGSVRAGSAVASEAGRAVKKTVLELGGNDPFILLEDADVESASAAAVEARLLNSGQSCIAGKRFIVVERVADAFLERFTARMKSRKVGDPLEAGTQVGPQARKDLRDALHRQVQASLERGAAARLGGTLPEGPGAYYPPSILVSVHPGMPAFDEEVFGPVAAVVRAQDDAEALRLANESAYGLGASLWTRDLERAERLAGGIEAGAVFVNGLVKSDPRLPFGGVKGSGYGRELSEFGLWEFVNVKSVWIR